MAKYRVTTDGGTYEVTTDEGAPPSVGNPLTENKSLIPQGLQPAKEPDPWHHPTEGLIGQGVSQVGQGIAALAQPDKQSRYRGGSDIISGAGKALTPVAIGATLPAAISAPLPTALGIAGATAGGYGGSALAKEGARAINASPEGEQFAGDVGGLAGSMTGGIGGSLPRTTAVAGGALKGGWEGGAAPSGIHIKGFEAPSSVAGSVMGAGVGALSGIPHAREVGAVIGAMAPVVRGMARGARQGLEDYRFSQELNAPRGEMSGMPSTLPPKPYGPTAPAVSAPLEPAPPGPGISAQARPSEYGIQGMGISPPKPAVSELPAPVPKWSNGRPKTPDEIAFEAAGVEDTPPIHEDPINDALTRAQSTVDARSSLPPQVTPQVTPPMESAYPMPDQPGSGTMVPKESYQQAARTVKARALARYLNTGGIPYEDAARMTPEHWALAAQDAGVNNPSAESIKAALAELQKIEAARSGLPRRITPEDLK